METETIRKTFQILKVHSPLSICNPRLNQWSFPTYESWFSSSLVILTDCPYSQAYSWLLWLPICCVSILSYYPNMYSYTNCTFKYLYFIASFLQVLWYLIFLENSYSWDLVWLMATILSLEWVSAQESLWHYLRVSSLFAKVFK